MKVRIVPESNYKSFYTTTEKTLRLPLNPEQPVTELEYPEFYDVKITNWCGARCPQCYQNSTEDEQHYPNVADRLKKFLDTIPKEHLPYQIAFGGGEPTAHPEFMDVLKVSREYGISPNFTTNGTEVLTWSCKKLEDLSKLVGGAAVSTHKHLLNVPHTAVRVLKCFNIPVNTHHIISDKASIDDFISLIDVYDPYVDYFVLLPYTNVGRAASKPKELDWDYFVSSFPYEVKDKIAFGANFYPYLKRGDLKLSVSLYEPELLSKYVDLRGHGYMYASSFSDEVLKEGFLE